VNYLAQLLTFRRLRKALSHEAGRTRRAQWARLKPLVDHAYRTVPYYRRRFDEAGVTPDDIQDLDDLSRIPISTKADLQAADPDDLLSSQHPRSSLVTEKTSGSSGRPLEMHFDEDYRRVRKALFLRALYDCGYRIGKRLLLTATREKKPVPKWMRWKYVYYMNPPLENVARMNEFKPDFLYGWVTPIRQMAEATRRAGVLVHRPDAVITTAETLDPATRTLLEETFQCPVYEIYGLTETGTIAWQSPHHDHFRISHESMIVEFLPAPEHDASRLVVTNLALRAMPFLRYDTGDLAAPTGATNNGTLPGLERVEGRVVDCVPLGDGRVVSPYQLTIAVEKVPGVARYQIIQNEDRCFVFRYEPKGNDGEHTAAAARDAIRGVVGAEAQVDVEREESLQPPPGCKFRVVESRVKQGAAC
jgi:phenylacetate-CoA ligase